MFVVCLRFAVIVALLSSCCFAKQIPNNHCQYYATDQDITTAGIYYDIMNYCTNYFGTKPDEVHVNADNYEYKMCLTAGQTVFGDLKPYAAMQTLAQDTYSNNVNQTVQHTFSLSGTYGQSISIGVSDSVAFSASVSYTVGIPDILSSTFSVSTTFTSQRTETHTDNADQSYTSSTTIDALPNCKYTAKLEADLNVFKSDMQTPICLDGFARCQFGSPVQGHYYWYVDIAPFISADRRCFTQHGVLSASVSIQSKTDIDRQCPPRPPTYQ